MKYNSAKNPAWANSEHTAILLVVDFDKIGEVTFGASPLDPEAHGREIFERAKTGDFGTVAEFVAPVLPRYIPQSVTRFQGMAMLMQAGLLDDIEAYMALETTDPFERLAWKEALHFERSSSLIAKIAEMLGLTDAMRDDMFVFAATIS